jgi:(p)ppGpp synthase/HD superfamily hydrolase
MKNHARGPILLMRVESYVGRMLEGILRKGATPTPVMVHMQEVKELLRLAGADDEIQAAGLLHDICNLTTVTESDIEYLFGKRVASTVSEVTDPPEFSDLPTQEKKVLQAKVMRTASSGGQMVRLADMTSNLRELERNPPVGWSPEKIQDYIYGDLRVANVCKESSPLLTKYFFEAFQAAQKKYCSSPTRA